MFGAGDPLCCSKGKIMRPIIPLFSTIAIVSAAAPALAEVAPDEIIVTVTRAEQPVSQIGQAISVISADMLRERQSVVVSDLLATTPGITFSRNGGVGTSTSIRIRGAEADQTVVLIDGVKLNDPSSPGGGFNFGNLLAGNIARIEILRGPNSVLWGSQAIGGVVNIVTSEPSGELSGSARAEHGWRDTGQVVGNVSGAIGPVAGSIGAGWVRTDGISTFNEDRGGIERDGYENFGANAKLRIALGEAVSVDLRGWYSRGKVGIDGFPPPTFAFGDTREFSRTRELIGYAGLNFDLLDGRFRNRIAFAYTDTNRDNFDPDATPERTFDAVGRNERLEYQGTFDIAEGWQATFGAETEKSRLRTASPSSFDPNPVPARGSARIDSFYGQLVGSPFAGLTLTAGLRRDDHDVFGEATTFGASGAWTPNRGATLFRASYGEGFKAPTLFQLQSEYGNAALRPERAKGWDAGVEQHLLDGAIIAVATWFHRDTTDQIDFISCFGSGAPICVGRPFGTYDNVQKTRAQGLEFIIDLKPVEALSFQAQYTYTDAENRLTGAALPRRAKHVVSTSIDYRWPLGFKTGATLLYVGSTFDNASNSRKLEGYVLASVRASYPLAEGIELYGRIENLHDDHYETTFRYGSPTRAAYGGVHVAF
jgi:vitamin B12 transporter